MKPSKMFERLRLSLSAAQSVDEQALIIEDEPLMTGPSTNLDHLNEDDWPSQDSSRVNSDFADLTIGTSRATESEKETIVSSSS